ncbi:MAG: N,N-dimethylformamidase beta subunit family domain-containing protein, partial [Dehalococcoidia bacterium]
MVRAENAQPGTVGWKITNFAVAGELQAYAGSQSVNAGGAVDLYVSSRLAGTKYQLEVFRMGWYGGLGARLMLTVGGLQARAQGYYAAAVGIAGCPTCRREASTGLIDAGWQPSYHLSVPQAWLSGAYLLKLTESHGKQTYVPLVVRQDDRTSALLVQTSVNTYEAYNAWGGKSLYDSNSSGAATVGGGPAAAKVSFNRPYEADFGSGHFLRYEYNLIRWLERQGYDATYTT